MDENGWIAREQILGDEARSKVPQEFQKQNNMHANPPTFFISILNFLENIKLGVNSHGEIQGDNSDLEFLKSIFPKLQKHYQWYLKTQTGVEKDSFRWRGRSKGHTFACGLDDYPRGVGTPLLTERHLDLYCWVYMMSEIMNQISETIGIKDNQYIQKQNVLLANFEKYHWNYKYEMFSDYVGPKKRANQTRGEFSNHVGYISLFPLISEMITIDSEKIEKLLNMISNPKELYTNYGLRSLSVSDKLFGTKENYWRGPIWININYLVLRSFSRMLSKSNKVSERHIKVKELYSKLRNNIIKNVHSVWKKTGSFFEQYNPNDGRGQRLNDFSGWTTLVLLILTEKY